MISNRWLFFWLLSTVQAFAVPTAYEPTSDDVRRVVNLHSSGIGRCYRDKKKSIPDLEGRFVLNFDLSPSGQVSGVSITGMRKKSPSFESCVDFEVRRWKFPKSHSNKMMKVRYAYSFD